MVQEIEKKMKDIVYYVGFNKSHSVGTNWSYTVERSEYDYWYPVVDYRDHTRYFEEFIEKYPWCSIDTSGTAKSEAAFGDWGKGEFGAVHYPTSYFDNSTQDGFRVYLINKESWVYGHWAYVKIGLDFKKSDAKLYLRPFIHGLMRSHGHYWRDLEFGLNVRNIIFHPKKN